MHPSSPVYLTLFYVLGISSSGDADSAVFFDLVGLDFVSAAEVLALTTPAI